MAFVNERIGEADKALIRRAPGGTPASNRSLRWTFAVMGVLGASVLLLPAELPSGAPVWQVVQEAARTFGDVRSLSGSSQFPFAAALSYGAALVFAPLLAIQGLRARRDREAFDARLAGRKPWKRILGMLFMFAVVVLLYGSEALHPSHSTDGFDRLISQHRLGLLIYVELAVLLMTGVFIWMLHELVVLLRSLRRDRSLS